MHRKQRKSGWEKKTRRTGGKGESKGKEVMRRTKDGRRTVEGKRWVLSEGIG